MYLIGFSGKAQFRRANWPIGPWAPTPLLIWKCSVVPAVIALQLRVIQIPARNKSRLIRFIIKQIYKKGHIFLMYSLSIFEVQWPSITYFKKYCMNKSKIQHSWNIPAIQILKFILDALNNYLGNWNGKILKFKGH